MAIQDRNLKAGTKLMARYKGQDHSAAVVEVEGKLVYRLADGREFKSPSAAGTTITGKSCNGWAFWSLEGDTKVRSSKVSPPPPRVRPAPKPKGKKTAKANGTATTDDQPSTTEGSVLCETCGESFASTLEATEHMATAHPA